MGNTSATGGILSPSAPLPADDSSLDAIFQSLVAGITGLPASLVRPRWQPVVPKQPPAGTDWCAISVTQITPDDGPYLDFDYAQTLVAVEQWDHEQLDVLATFYGPNRSSFARVLRAGLNIPQNWESLTAQNIAYVNVGSIRQVPEKVNEVWITRADVPLTFRRKVMLNYAVENILVAEIILTDDITVIHDTIIVPPGSIVEP